MQSTRGKTNVCVCMEVMSSLTVYRQQGIGNIVDNRAHVEQKKRREAQEYVGFYFLMILLSHVEVAQHTESQRLAFVILNAWESGSPCQASVPGSVNR